MQAKVNGNNIVIVTDDNKPISITATTAIELATSLKSAAATLASHTIARQQEALQNANALLEAANAV